MAGELHARVSSEALASAELVANTRGSAPTPTWPWERDDGRTTHVEKSLATKRRLKIRNPLCPSLVRSVIFTASCSPRTRHN